MYSKYGVIKNVLRGDNFKVTGVSPMIDATDPIMGLHYTRFDERTLFITTDFDETNWNWYFNYLTSMNALASKNRDAHCNYILDLGYVPVIYLPSCCTDKNTELMNALRESQLPYITMAATSFVTKFCNIDATDVWVNKLDAAEYLNCAPEDVRSVDIVRRMLNV